MYQIYLGSPISTFANFRVCPKFIRVKTKNPLHFPIMHTLEHLSIALLLIDNVPRTWNYYLGEPLVVLVAYLFVYKFAKAL